MEGVIQMKVLFAVNSESISDAIIKKYQKDYREILSYKNVYYFNAIQKEIQKDKSYDRIVISADLEPFSNNNYESIDKFIFEKLDGISDEAHDTSGNEISIILICSDRHTKGSSFLVKLFGLGIYNALLGNDRSMEEVCRLINKPRTKKEAKMYYKIDTDDVNYRTESGDEVDELQIQNILFHFRKLGKNTEKYASSFENIATQYTDKQLKIIINCLPANVKRVLEETSTKYQETMAATGAIIQGVRNNDMANKEDQKRTGLKIDIIENKLNQTKVNGPIVIPNSVKSTGSANAKKVIAVPQKKEGIQEELKPKTESSPNPVKKVTPELKKSQENVPNKELANAEEKLVRLPNGKIVKKVVKPERKAEIPEGNSTKIVPETKANDPFADLEDLSLEPTVKPNVEKKEVETMEQPKKGRGRPRKNPVEPVENKPKGKRGRPRKNPIEEPKSEIVKPEVVKPEMVKPKISNLETEELPDLEPIKEKSYRFNSFDDDDFMVDFDEPVESTDFEDLIEDAPMVKQEPEVETFDSPLEEIELPELDELDDIDAFDDDEKDEFSSLTEEAFDEFDDYDEYGQYQTKKKIAIPKEDVDQLYAEDILSEEGDEFAELEAKEEPIDFDESDLDAFEELEDANLETDLGTDEMEDILLSELDDEEDILSAVELPEEETLFEEESAFAPEDNLGHEAVEPEYKLENNSQNSYNYEAEAIQSITSPIDYSMSNLNSLMTKDKKIVTFLGSPKNGVSFLVNNLAEFFASIGINTAVLDMTKNRNSYYIYTQNEEALRQISYTSLDKLQNGVANGIKIKQNLTVYTALPSDEKEYSNVEGILSTLVQNHSLVLVDCDFDTNPAYFASCQEIYLVQSMDILTIQPLTAFLRDLKTQGVFEAEKVRVVINKELKVRGLTNRIIIGGMSSYNDPAMSFMTELFNKEDVKYCSIPFEEMAYSKYLEGMLNCKVSLSGYSKNFMNKLKVLADMVYPLTSRQTYSPNRKPNYKQNNFSNSMNDTLNKMKRNY